MLRLTQEDVKKLKAAGAADFSSLTLEQKHEFLNRAMCGTLADQVKQLRKYRQEKKKLVQDSFNWMSYLKPKELIMMGGLDREVAESLHKKSVMYHKLGKKSKDHFYKFLSFENCLRVDRSEQVRMGNEAGLEKYEPSYYDEAIFVDTKLKNKKNKKEKRIAVEETRCKGDSEEFKSMLAEGESYDTRMYEITRDPMTRKKIGFNQADDDVGACSESRFDEMSRKNLESIEMALERRWDQRKLRWSLGGLLILIGAYSIRKLSGDAQPEVGLTSALVL